ncbi:hypothetical protein VTN00DRAFT_5362 [Thermoascus crustaceus]|uniref:uncharacterized protein n=1 Tax=Thermoascus crustaceus TaxID=5088 RepID=UPI003742D6C4
MTRRRDILSSLKALARPGPSQKRRCGDVVHGGDETMKLRRLCTVLRPAIIMSPDDEDGKGLYRIAVLHVLEGETARLKSRRGSDKPAQQLARGVNVVMKAIQTAQELW